MAPGRGVVPEQAVHLGQRAGLLVEYQGGRIENAATLTGARRADCYRAGTIRRSIRCISPG